MGRAPGFRGRPDGASRVAGARGDGTRKRRRAGRIGCFGQQSVPRRGPCRVFIADRAWFLVGRRYGRDVLAGICRLSLSPDTCVRNTDDRIARHGAAVLLVAKFIPGVSAVAVRRRRRWACTYRRFALFDSLGCALWSGVYVGVGMIFGREVNRLLDWMSLVGGRSIAVLSGLFALYLDGSSCIDCGCAVCIGSSASPLMRSLHSARARPGSAHSRCAVFARPRRRSANAATACHGG